MLNKIAILVKTSIQYDGRVISQIDNLSKKFNNTEFKIFLLSDDHYEIQFNNNCKVDEITLFTKFLPKNFFFQFLKTLEFGFKSYLKIKAFDPDILHVHDDTAIIGGLFYKTFHPNKKIIYDDHELKYIRSKSISDSLVFLMEKYMYKISDLIIVANPERKRLASLIYNVKTISVQENFFYNNYAQRKKNKNLMVLEKKIKKIQKQKKKIILHQGQVSEVRGSKNLINLSNNLPNNFNILFIGININSYKEFLKKIHISKHNNFIFGGFIDYEHIGEVYRLIDYSLIMYKPYNLNNKYCAPNRVYLAYYFGKPIIVNEDNPVLRSFVKKAGSGQVINKYSNFVKLFENLERSPNLVNQRYINNDTYPKNIISIYNKFMKKW